MRIEFFGLVMEAPRATFYMWSPWRASAMEHRVFDAIRNLSGVVMEQEPDEVRVHVEDPRTFKQALTHVSRILKGWQEEAEQGRERRVWRWLFEGDTDDSGYDHAGEPACLWAFLRLGLERAGNFEEAERFEEIDLNGFGLRIWPVTTTAART